MSKSKKQQFSVTAGEFTARKSEYDDEELDFVRGKKIDVKSGGGAGGATKSGAGKGYSTGGSEYQHQNIHTQTIVTAGCIILAYP